MLPETTIGEKVKIHGELSFDRLLKISGVFEGLLHTSNVMIKQV